MICVSLVLFRNVDKYMAWILPLLSDKDANMNVQVFVLHKDTADILGKTIKDGIGNDKILIFNHGNLIIWIIAEWGWVDALGLVNFTSSQIEKLSGDNTRDEKERWLLRCSRRGGMQWGLPSWRAVCKLCFNCSNKCSCNFANTGADKSLARHLLPRISPEYL